jgi:Fe-S cluster assembly protein SufD
MNAEQQYIDLYEQAQGAIFAHSIGEMNAVRNQAFADFRRLGFPSR